MEAAGKTTEIAGGLNQSRSLSGIETPLIDFVVVSIRVSINHAPYQGLKHLTVTHSKDKRASLNQSRSLSGIET